MIDFPDFPNWSKQLAGTNSVIIISKISEGWVIFTVTNKPLLTKVVFKGVLAKPFSKHITDILTKKIFDKLDRWADSYLSSLIPSNVCHEINIFALALSVNWLATTHLSFWKWTQQNHGGYLQQLRLWLMMAEDFLLADLKWELLQDSKYTLTLDDKIVKWRWQTYRLLFRICSRREEWITRSFGITAINWLLHFASNSVLPDGTLNNDTPLYFCRRETRQPKMEQLAPGMITNIHYTIQKLIQNKQKDVCLHQIFTKGHFKFAAHSWNWVLASIF